MNEILINAMTILVLLAGLAALIVWVRRDTFSGAPDATPGRYLPDSVARESHRDSSRLVNRPSRRSLAGLSQQ